MPLTKSVLLAPNRAIQFDDPIIYPDKYPMYCSTKFDGLRILVYEGNLYTRRLRPVDNPQVTQYFSKLCELSLKLNLVFDGEFYSHKRTFQELSSLFRRSGAAIPADVRFMCFDAITHEQWGNKHTLAYIDRLREVYALFGPDPNKTKVANCRAVIQTLAHTPEEAETAYEDAITQGYEGVMLRDPYGLYKHGRATLKQGIMYKFKQFVTTDAQIIGFVQKQVMTQAHANDPNRIAERTVTGHQKRHHFKANYVPIKAIGSYILRTAEGGVTFNATVARNTPLPITWENKYEYVNKWVEVRYMKVGMKDKPRIAAITRMRPDLD